MERKEKLWSFEFIYLLIIATVVSTSFYMTMPIIAKYSMMLGASLSLAGVIAGLFSLTALLIRPIGGFISDRFSKKYIIVCSTFLMCIAALGCSVSDHIYSLIIFRLLHGVGFAINSTATITLVSEKLPLKRLGEGIGWFGISFIVAAAIGPGIGAVIGSEFGYHEADVVS
ncbi:MAG: MFS transporter, partial [Actinobacteria bacterium]|nr:MFS transporter [Actinomycetota bacterium]